jgi:hypothetical protein
MSVASLDALQSFLLIAAPLCMALFGIAVVLSCCANNEE